MTKRFIILLIAISFCRGMNAQTNENEYITGDENNKINDFNKKQAEIFGSFIIASAIDEFPGTPSNNYGFGVGGGFVINPLNKSNILNLGLDFGYLHMGKDKTVIDSIPLKTTLSIYPVNLILRLRLPSTYTINPYVDLLAGVQYIETNTKYNNSVVESAAGEILDVDTKTLFTTSNSTPLTYGFDLGLSINFKKANVSTLDIGFRYIKGSSASYSSPEDLRITNRGNFHYLSSKLNSTNMMYFHIGINFYINKS